MDQNIKNKSSNNQIEILIKVGNYQNLEKKFFITIIIRYKYFLDKYDIKSEELINFIHKNYFPIKCKNEKNFLIFNKLIKNKNIKTIFKSYLKKKKYSK